MTTANLTAADARCAILNLGEVYSFETIATLLVLQMSGNEARENLEYLYAELTA